MVKHCKGKPAYVLLLNRRAAAYVVLSVAYGTWELFSDLTRTVFGG